jgi:mono/diheme cytochrome c family protein
VIPTPVDRFRFVRNALRAAAMLLPAALMAQTPAAAPAQTGAEFNAVVGKYCVTCHNDRLKTAGFVLTGKDFSKVGEHAEEFEKVLIKVKTATMPPPNIPRPDATFYKNFASYLETELDRAGMENLDPGRPALHRLNRTEYQNAIRDLLGLEVDASTLLPTDDASFGFDNVGDVLTVSPTLMERYLVASGKIVRSALGDTTMQPATEVYSVPTRTIQDDRAGELTPFGSRGGLAFEHYFPVDGEYEIRIRLARDRVHDIIGLMDQHELDVRLDGAQLQSYEVGGAAKDQPRYYGQDYDKPVSGEAESYERTADSGMVYKFTAKAGQRVVSVAFLKKSGLPEGVYRRRLAGAQYTQADDIPGVGHVLITGPLRIAGSGDTASRRLILSCNPAKAADETPCAKQILSRLARRAYRRPPTDAELQTLMSFYETGRKEAPAKANAHEAGISMALRRMLVAPQFLFRQEVDPAGIDPGKAYRISDLELASRLSFFLWSSIPDEQLLELAEKGKLKDPKVLEQQARRMMADPRAEALITNFAGQWLYLRNMEKVTPDPEIFPEFDENLREAFRTETRLFIESMLREDHSVMDLMRANYTFLNERLARHYGIPGVYGSHFRRVTLNDPNRMGLIGQGAILTVTSYPNRTSPTFRGKWMLENILGTPPPPPPPAVPSLKVDPERLRKLSMREMMEQHRQNPACFGCHSRMDPMGFALENFDAIGRWRTTSGTAKIDSSGTLPDGSKFSGPVELRELLAGRADEVVSATTRKMMTYALGRGVEYYDMPTVRAIVREAAPTDYKWSSIILGIIRSAPFQMRRSARS